MKALVELGSESACKTGY